MSRRNICQACSFLRYGVKGRVDHTCGLDPKDWPVPPKHEYAPTREELDKYLAKLKELMEPGSEPYKPRNEKNPVMAV